MSKYTRETLLNIFKELNSFDKTSQYSKHLLYKISKNAKKFQPIFDEVVVKEKELQTEEFITLENGRLEILKKYSKKDETGNPVVENNTVVIEDELRTELEAEIAKYIEDNKETIKEYETVSKAHKEWLLEEIEFEFEKVKFEYIPELIDVKTFNLFSLLVEED